MIPHEIRFIATVFVSAVFGCGMLSAEAQQRMRTKSGKGRITNVAPGLLEVRDTSSGDFWLLQPGGPEIRFTAKATPAWLTTRMVVRVTGEFDRKGVAVSEIDTIQVFTPSAELPIGVLSDSRNAPRSREPIQALSVAGPIARRDERTIKIAAGKKTFTVTLAEDAKVEVDLIRDLNWVRVGDEVDFKARYYQPGRGVAAKLIVHSPQPLDAITTADETGGHPTRKRATQKSPDEAASKSKDKQSEEEKEPAAS